jgi:hypothetical protein
MNGARPVPVGESHRAPLRDRQKGLGKIIVVRTEVRSERLTCCRTWGAAELEHGSGLGGIATDLHHLGRKAEHFLGGFSGKGQK